MDAAGEHMITIYHINAGSSGAEERVLTETVAVSRNLGWAATPEQADIFIVSGPIPGGVRPALLTLWRDYIAGRVPLVALGRASIDGHPFGKGGLAELSEIQVAAKIDGDPPTVAAIQAGITQALQARLSRH